MGTQERRRRIPSVDALLRTPPAKKAAEEFGRPLIRAAVKEVLDTAREAATRGIEPTSEEALLARAIGRAATVTFGLTPAINATGVVLHTGLGRAPLPEEAVASVAKAARGYSDLEIDRETGTRRGRTARAEMLVTALTGAEAALVVNNNAASLLLALAALAKRKEVLVSRGELIEIGGDFRLPEIMAASGAKLLEVGTTNRTKIADYRSALSGRTGLILKVHPSNYRVVGFAQAPPVSELSTLARKKGIPFLYDLGSGLLDRFNGIPAEEPAAIESLRQGADLVCFSGDKLLGGPQAGIVAGRADLVERLRKHPIARAVRVDKMQISALGSVLAAYSQGRQLELPTWRMLRAPASEVKHSAEQLAKALDGDLEGATVVASEAAVGGGSLPGFVLPSFAVRLETKTPDRFAAHLRNGRPPVFCKVEEGAAVFDLRTVDPADFERLARAITYAMESDGREEND
ncbi:MAG: L-seryl-tRNA(Sec) selenium transferase [Actinomycetota bacterium]